MYRKTVPQIVHPRFPNIAKVKKVFAVPRKKPTFVRAYKVAKTEYMRATQLIIKPKRNHRWNYLVTSVTFSKPIGLPIAASDSGHE